MTKQPNAYDNFWKNIKFEESENKMAEKDEIYYNQYVVELKIKGLVKDNSPPPISLIELEKTIKDKLKFLFNEKFYKPESFIGFNVLSEKHFEKTHLISVFGVKKYFNKVSQEDSVKYLSYDDYVQGKEIFYDGFEENGEDWIHFQDIKAKLIKNYEETVPREVSENADESDAATDFFQKLRAKPQ